jgi:multidrug efflux pump subunit AcrA (membrane-fusion protein)
MNRNKITLSMGFVLVAVLFLSACALPMPPVPGGQATVKQTPAVTSPAVAGNSIVAQGSVIPMRDTVLSFATSGIVSEVLVTEGQDVQSGQVLARLSGAQPLQASLSGAELNLLTAQLALEQMISPEAIANAKLAITAVQTNVTNAQTALNNLQYWQNTALIQNYYANYVIAKSNLDKAQTAYDNANGGVYINNTNQAAAYNTLYTAQQAYNTAQYYYSLYSQKPTQRTEDEAQANLDLANATLKNAEIYLTALNGGDIPVNSTGTAIMQLQQAKLNVQVMQDQVEAAKAALANLELKAPFGGTVSSLNLDVGMFVQPGIEVAKLADTSSWLVKTTDLTELNVVKIQPGMSATVILDALPEVKMAGEVQTIEKFGENHLGDIVYAVTLKLNQPDPRLRWNMTAIVTFTVK